MYKLHFVLATMALTLIPLWQVFAQPVQDLEELQIIEIQTAGIKSASAEFIEIYNPNLTSIDLSGFKIQYKSASGSSWSTKASLSKVIGPRSRALIATSHLQLDQALELGSGLAGSGGHVQLIEASDTITKHDLVGWGSAQATMVAAAPAPEAGQSLKRAVNEDGYFINTDDNSSDFIVSDIPSPFSDPLLEVEDEEVLGDNNNESDNQDETPDPQLPEEPEENEDNQEVPNPIEPEQPDRDSGPETTDPPKTYHKLELSELFPDPDSPLSDSEDEFIEIFNPNNFAVELEGYKIQAGTDWRYSHTFNDEKITAKSYRYVTSGDSSLTLSNSGSQVRIIDPNSKQLSAISYVDAQTGLSLSNIGGQWQWTNQVTPGSKNKSALADNQEEGDSGSGSTSDSSEDESEVIDIPLVAGISDNSDSDDESRAEYEEPPIQAPESLNNSALVGVGGLAVLYVGYEYRHDIGNRIQQLRSNFRHWRENRKSA